MECPVYLGDDFHFHSFSRDTHSPVYLECVRLLGEAYVERSGDTSFIALAVDAFVMAVVLQLKQWRLR